MRAAGQGHGRNDAATSQRLALGLRGPKLQILGVRLGPGSRLGLGRPGAWGPGPQGLGALGLGVALKSLLLGGWRRGGSQLNNYDETRSDHGPVGITWLCYILVTIDYATYL